MRDAGDVRNDSVAKRMRSTKIFVHHVTNSHHVANKQYTHTGHLEKLQKQKESGVTSSIDTPDAMTWCTQ